MTTGKLHTKMEDIYTMLEEITGVNGLMTTTLGPANKALMPFLKKRIEDKRFWDDKYDITHIGMIKIKVLTEKEQPKFKESLKKEISAFWDRSNK